MWAKKARHTHQTRQPPNTKTTKPQTSKPPKNYPHHHQQKPTKSKSIYPPPPNVIYVNCMPPYRPSYPLSSTFINAPIGPPAPPLDLVPPIIAWLPHQWLRIPPSPSHVQRMDWMCDGFTERPRNFAFYSSSSVFDVELMNK
jgi:hypothetical protein